jgi:hypothetical protein
MTDSPRNHPTMTAREVAEQRLQNLRANAEEIYRRLGEAAKGTNADIRVLAVGLVELARIVEAMLPREVQGR